MKIQVKNYIFDKTAKTITFSDYSSIDLDSILLITNVTSNIIIYNFADTAKGGTVLTNVLTLTFDTSSMVNTDKLLIYYDDPAKNSDVTNIATIAKQNEIINGISNKDIMFALKTLIQAISNPSYVDKSANQLRAQVTGTVTSSTALTSLTTLTTLTTLSNLDGYQAKLGPIHENMTAWQLSVRNKIT